MLEKKVLQQLKDYVERRLHGVPVLDPRRQGRLLYSTKSIHEDRIYAEMEDFIKNNRKPSFAGVLFTFIDIKGTSVLEIYKKAGIDRRHFSKIRSNPGYRPGGFLMLKLFPGLAKAGWVKRLWVLQLQLF